MLFNDKELKLLSTKSATVQGTLQYLKPQTKDWSDWIQPSAYKDRVFKLINNFLFYYRTTDLENPLGVFVLEHMQVAYVSSGTAAFAFSLTSNDGTHLFACRCQEDLNKWVAALKVASYTYWKSQHEVLQCKLAKHKGIAWKSPYSQQVPEKQIRKAKQQDPGVQQVQQISRNHSQNKHSTFYQMQETPQVDNNSVSVITKKMSQSTFYSSHSEVSNTVRTSSVHEQRRVSSTSSTQSSNHLMNHQQQHVKVQNSNVPVDNLIDL